MASTTIQSSPGKHGEVGEHSGYGQHDLYGSPGLHDLCGLYSNEIYQTRLKQQKFSSHTKSYLTERSWKKSLI